MYLLVSIWTEAIFSAREERNAAAVIPLCCLEFILKHLTECRQNVLSPASRRRPSFVLF
jgi:hypothetical protein